MEPPARGSARPARPMTNETRARLGGLEVVVRRGPEYMQAIGRQRRAGLDRRIAADAGIPDDLPPDQYATRLKAARSAYFIRLAGRRWSAAAQEEPIVPPSPGRRRLREARSVEVEP